MRKAVKSHAPYRLKYPGWIWVASRHTRTRLGGATITGTARRYPGGGRVAQGFGATYGAGTTDVIVLAEKLSPVETTLIIRYRCNGAGGGNFGRLLQKGTTTNGEESLFVTTAFGSPRLIWHRTNSAGVVLFSGVITDNAVNDNVVHTLVLANDGSASTPIAYQDGVAQTYVFQSPSTTNAANNTDPYRIGNRSDGARVWDGMLESIIRLDWTLSNAELRAISLDQSRVFQSAPEFSIFLPTTGGTVFSVGVSESIALSSGQSALVAAEVGVSEAASLTDAATVAQVGTAVIVESANLASAQSIGQVVATTTTEAAALSTTESATQATNMTTTEVLTLAELTATSMVSSVSLSEAATLADSAAAVNAVVASLTEAAALSSAQDGIGSMGVSVSEAAALADTTGTGTGTLFTVDVGEIVTLASSTSALAAYIVSTLDAMALDSAHSVGQATAVIITEPMALVESISLGAQLIAVSQSEALALADSAAVQKATLGAVLEALNMASQEGATLAGSVLIAESMFLSDAIGAGAVSVLSIGETMTLAEVVRWISSLSTDPTFTASADPLNRTAVAGVRVLIAKAMPGNFTAKWRK